MLDASSQFAHGEILLKKIDALSAKAIAARLSAGNVKATIQNPELK
jgi:hypothetical protein